LDGFLNASDLRGYLFGGVGEYVRKLIIELGALEVALSGCCFFDERMDL
jgi:hypothetical protein